MYRILELLNMESEEFDTDYQNIIDILFENQQHFKENDYLEICLLMKSIWKKRKISRNKKLTCFEFICINILILCCLFVFQCFNVYYLNENLYKLHFIDHKYYCWKI